ncbi:MAG TPA: hypothetical protein VI688_06480 [Anaerolineales bacterium]|nr:hypothetical protein [Anaerolineales bacterium]
MKTQIFALVVLVALLSACAPAPAETEAAAVENTPTASSTPAPTDTPTATPTPTMDLQATQQAEEAARKAEEAAFIADVVAPDLELAGVSADEGELIYRMDSPMEISAPEADTFYWEYLNNADFALKNYVFTVDVSWDSTGFAGCNIVLRGARDFDWDSQEMMMFRTLRLSGAPAWDMIIIKNGRIQSTVAESTNGAIEVESGDVNHLVFVVKGPNALAYANGYRLGLGTAKATMTEGHVYLTVISYTGSSSCTYSNGWVWELPEEGN